MPRVILMLFPRTFDSGKPIALHFLAQFEMVGIGQWQSGPIRAVNLQNCNVVLLVDATTVASAFLIA